MKCIKDVDPWLVDKLIKQPLHNNPYRLSKFVVRLSVDGGFLMYNTVTGCLLFFKDEQDYNNSKDFLISNWFYIPANNFDEFNWTDFLRNKKRELLENNMTKSYVIMTTMDCNARCFYCYEKGRASISMTDKIANDIGDFIAKNGTKNRVKISWFGGEPLVNKEAIDIICKRLQQNGVNYVSHIISNGLLFSESVIKQAKKVWNLKKAQITIDGTEETYLRIKAFKNGCGNEFRIVMNNILELLKNNVHVSIRLNQNLENTDDLIRLVDYIDEKFEGFKNLSVYNRLLFDEEITDEIQEAYFSLKSRLRQMGLLKPYLKEGISYSQCMADNDSSCVINPVGKLGKCEHFSDSNFIGSIYDKDFDCQAIAMFKERFGRLVDCNTCAFYPCCVRLKMCPSQLESCTEFFRKDLLTDLHYMLMSCYRQFKRSTKINKNDL